MSNLEKRFVSNVSFKTESKLCCINLPVIELKANPHTWLCKNKNISFYTDVLIFFKNYVDFVAIRFFLYNTSIHLPIYQLKSSLTVRFVVLRIVRAIIIVITNSKIVFLFLLRHRRVCHTHLYENKVRILRWVWENIRV